MTELITKATAANDAAAIAADQKKRRYDDTARSTRGGNPEDLDRVIEALEEYLEAVRALRAASIQLAEARRIHAWNEEQAKKEEIREARALLGIGPVPPPKPKRLLRVVSR